MMVEPGMLQRGTNDKLAAESSCNAYNQFPQKEADYTYHPYPSPQAAYEDVVVSRELFMDSLKKLHSAMGTKFMIPIVGGKALDLHHLFVEVTSRGGIAKVLNDKRWKEVISVFSFPSSATNASFILRKYYASLLYHYEQLYFFKAKGWSSSTGATTPSLAKQFLPSLPGAEGASQQQLREDTSTSLPQANLAQSTGSPVSGIIDGKFESGYLVTVTIGLEEYKGVLYQASQTESNHIPLNHGTIKEQRMPRTNSDNLGVKTGPPRRKRRKKSEIRKRDPAHPKPNRSGYNFFFAEQHARLKPLYPGKDREISRMIGELWNKLQEPERSVYQEKALRDKERYRLEMADYRERLRSGHIINNVLPPYHTQTRDINTVGPVKNNPPLEHMNSTKSEEYEASSDNWSKRRNSVDESADRDSDMGASSQADNKLTNVGIQISAHEGAFEMQRELNVVGCAEKDLQDDIMGEMTNPLPCENIYTSFDEDGVSVPIERSKEVNSNANESNT